MKKALKLLLIALLAVSAMLVPVFGQPNDNGGHRIANVSPGGQDPLGDPMLNEPGVPYGATVYVYPSTGHTFHSANYNSRTGVTTFVNPTYLGSQLYSRPLQMSDGSVVLYGYNDYYPLGYNQLSGKYYFYGTQTYFEDYAANDPWYRTVALPFLRNTYGAVPGYSNIVFVSNPYTTYSYSSYVHYGGYGDWLGFV